MGRPISKMTIGKLKFLLEKSGKLPTKEIGKKLGIHHSTVVYYQKKLRKAGHKVPVFNHSQINGLIKKLESPNENSKV